MQFQIRILGSSSALPTSTRMPTAQVVMYNETPYLIDCAEGTQMQMRKFSIPFGKLKNIFISHLHGDHFYGIFGLLSSFNLLGRKQDLNIYAPEELKIIYETVLSLNKDHLKYTVNFFPLKGNGKNLIFENKYLEVYSFPLKHTKPTYGFLFIEKMKPLNIRKDIIERYELSITEILKIKAGEDLIDDFGDIIKNSELTTKPGDIRSYAFCTDTLPLKQLDKYFKNVNLLYHEATFTEDMVELAKETHHSTAKQAAEIANITEAKKLLIGHFSSRYHFSDIFIQEAEEIFQDVIAAEDGMLINL
ncbi:MAG TPA: ribonuclease Z [Bacteroidales bacterium]|nr:ribonuclease Z [Bacteroidales bacterium]